jgi:hypothetical protein
VRDDAELQQPLELADQEVLGLADGPLPARVDPPELVALKRRPMNVSYKPVSAS